MLDATIATPAGHSTPARRAFATLALLAAVLTFLVVVASAFMRHAQAGLSCGDWPACYARVGGIADAPGIPVARGIHRAAATGVALAVLALACLRRAPAGAKRWAWVALAIVAGLAALGVATPGARLPAVALANLVGGFALLAVLAAAQARAAEIDDVPRRVNALAGATLALAVVQAVLGGLVTTQSGLLACPSFPLCDQASVRELVTGGAWNPLRAPTEADGRVIAPAGAAALHVAHRVNSLLLATTVLAVAWRLWRPRARLAAGLVFALGIGVFAGIAAALVPKVLGVALVHNAAAAALIALLARAALSGGVSEKPVPIR